MTCKKKNVEGYFMQPFFAMRRGCIYKSLALASIARDDPPASTAKQHGEQHGARQQHGGRNAR